MTSFVIRRHFCHKRVATGSCKSKIVADKHLCFWFDIFMLILALKTYYYYLCNILILTAHQCSHYFCVHIYWINIYWMNVPIYIAERSLWLAAGDNGSMHFWDWRSGYNFQRVQAAVQPGSIDSEAGIFASTFDKTGCRLITCEADKTIKIYKEDDTAVRSSCLVSNRKRYSGETELYSLCFFEFCGF